MVACIFGIRLRIASDTNRCRGLPRGVRGVAAVVWDACSEAIWREISSTRSSIPDVLSDIERQTVTVVG
jgi:hypothetical protein